MVQALFGLINFALPSQIPYYFGLFFSYANIGNGLFPMSDILLALFSVLAVWLTLYTVKIILWGLRIIPFVGNLGFLPQHSTQTNSTTHITTTGDDGVVHNKVVQTDRTSEAKKRWMR